MQTRLGSGVETVINVGSGFFIAMILNLTFLPLFTEDIAKGTLPIAILIGITYTGISMIRSYLFRRFFDGIFKKA